MKQFLHICVPAIILMLLVSSVAIAADWPCHRADAARSANTDEEISFPITLSWVYKPSQAPRPAWPDPRKETHRMPFDYAPSTVIAGGLVYFGSSADDTVRALDIETGSLRWRFTTNGPVRFAPAVYNARIYIASDDGWLYCLKADTGDLVWKFQAAFRDDMLIGNERMISRWPLRSGVLVDDGKVYITAGMWPAEGVFIYALDADTGEVLWCNDTSDTMYIPQPHNGAYAMTGVSPQGYLLVSKDILLVPTGRAIPAAFDRHTGKFLYYRHAENKYEGSSWATIDEDSDSFFVDTLRGIYQYRLSSGDLIDNKAYAKPDKSWIPPNQASTGRILIKGQQGIITAYDRSSQDEIWRSEIQGFARYIAVADGRVLASTDDGRIYCFGPGEGARMETSMSLKRAEPGQIALMTLNQLDERNISKGYALVIGQPETGFARALAEQAQLHVLNLLSDEEAVERERQRVLDETALYGTRIAVTSVADPEHLPFSPYFANLVVAGQDLNTASCKELYRVLRPYGGIMITPGISRSNAEAILKNAGVPPEEIYSIGDTAMVVRGELPGAFDWDSEDPSDEFVGGPLELLWFGGPGPDRMMDRHWRAPSSRPANGRYFVPGTHHVIAVDAYNGTELWSRFIPYTLGRYTRSLKSLAADDDHVYLNFGSVCYQLDAQTGEQQNVYGSFKESERHILDQPKQFHVKVDNSHSGSITMKQTPEGVELQLTTEDPKVTRLDSWELFFDFRPPDRRFNLYERGIFQIYVQTSTGNLRPFINHAEQIWEPDDASKHPKVDLEKNPAESGTSITLRMSWDEIKLFYEKILSKKREGIDPVSIQKFTGINPDEFAFAATLVSYDGASGEIYVRKNLLGDDCSGVFNSGWPTFVVRERDEVDSAPYAIPRIVESMDSLPKYALEWGRLPVRTDEQRDTYVGQRIHPLMDTATQKLYQRAYGCGGIISSAGMDFFRSGTIGFYDFVDDSGLRNFGAVRPGCGLSMVPALGLLIANEGTSGCKCAYNFQCSLALAPSEEQKNEDWAIYYDKGSLGASVQNAAFNLGAPGDRRDDAGRLWLGYPRGISVQAKKALATPFHLDFDNRFGPYRFDSDRTLVQGTDIPWVYASGVRGLERAVLDLSYYDPDQACLSSPCQNPPSIDGRLDDPIWDGSRQIPISDRMASAFVRHDSDNLYIAYQQRAQIDRRGNVTPWKMNAEGEDALVWEDDSVEAHIGGPGKCRPLAAPNPDFPAQNLSRAKIMHIGVSASGARYDSYWEPTLQIPRIDGITIDGDSIDWQKQGFQSKVVRNGVCRLAWNEEGLLFTLNLPADPEAQGNKRFSDLYFMTARPGSTDFLELAVDLDSQKCSSGHRLAKGDAMQPVEFAENRTQATYSIEALFPWQDLDIAPANGSEVGFPMIYMVDRSNSSRDLQEGLRRNFLSELSWQILPVLRLADQPSPPADMVYSIRGQEPGLAYFATVDDESWDGKWSSAVSLEGKSFAIELAIPWKILDEMGLEKNNLKIDFRTKGGRNAMPDLAWKRFNSTALKLVLEDSVPEQRPYTVRLHFCEPDDVEPGQRVFDIKLQGKTVMENLDIVKETGGRNAALVREFTGIPASKTIELELIPRDQTLDDKSAPIISAIEVQ